MHIRPVTGPVPTGPDPIRLPQPRRRRDWLWLTLAGSVLVHVALLLALWLWPEPDMPDGQEAIAANDVSLVMQGAAQSPSPASTKSPDGQTAAAAKGVPDAPVKPPSPNTTPQVEAASTPTPPPPVDQPPPPTPEAVAPPTPTPPPPAPVQEASIPTPPPPVPDTTPPPPAPTTPPQVSLTPPPPEQAVPQSPEFVMPQPPPPLPPLPRPVRPPPRTYARQAPRNPSAFPTPQNWSLNQTPSQSPFSSSHGIDLGTAPKGGDSDQEFQHLGGADPGDGWMSRLKRWAQEHSYYPDEALQEEQQGNVTVDLVIDHTGRVLSVQLVNGSGSPFLDGAWQSEWRNARVPSFPQGTMGDTTKIRYTIEYHLIRR